MNNIKSLIKKILGKKLIFYINYIKKLRRKMYADKKLLTFLPIGLKVKVYAGDDKIQRLFKEINLRDASENEPFYYNLDEFKTLESINDVLGNLTMDYKRCLNNSLSDFRTELENHKVNEKFYNKEISTIESIEMLIDRIIKKLQEQNANKDIIDSLENIKDKKADSFKDALQRILFFNQLLWQTGHPLNGLGRLDKILGSYYESDLKNGIINKNEAKELIKEFLRVLHKDYKFKSNNLLGDTGQIIELGGKEVDGSYFCNELTYIFINAMKEVATPDPKILLRVSSKTPRKIMQTALECISTGIGCPLFANDDVVIDKLIDFGYEKGDAYNYGTAACWEPFIIGKSSELNNMASIVFIEPLDDLLKNEDLSKIKNMKNLMSLYNKYLRMYLDDFIKQYKDKQWEEDPILSLFTDDCIKRGKDISKGGAVYNNSGFTGVGLSNLVNAILNIKELVFEKKKYTLEELNEFRKNNFEGNEDLVKELKNTKLKYGIDNEEVIDLSNAIIKETSKITKKYTNSLGGKFKFGLSSPNYINDSKDVDASFDGRKKGEPFGVHISSDNSNAYTELVEFASKLDYGENRFNGNVVDFMVSPTFIKDNFEKFLDFLCLSIEVGYFEMQMNVISSETLIKAKENPELFPNLIVRVWGFSAYFKDLPEEYKEYIIERALQSEGNSK